MTKKEREEFEKLDLNYAMRVCIRRGIKCYLVRNKNGGGYFVEVNNNGKITLFEKQLNTIPKANNALEITYKYFANKSLC